MASDSGICAVVHTACAAPACKPALNLLPDRLLASGIPCGRVKIIGSLGIVLVGLHRESFPPDRGRSVSFDKIRTYRITLTLRRSAPFVLMIVVDAAIALRFVTASCRHLYPQCSWHVQLLLSVVLRDYSIDRHRLNLLCTCHATSMISTEFIRPY
jgi:hypothetical protein